MVLLMVACGHQTPPPTTLRATPVHKMAVPGSGGCSTDADCDTGFRCAIGRSGTASVCMKDDDDAFRSAVDLPVATCTFSTDCPVGLHCDRDGNVCVK
jgi:hypothetical protein